MNIWHFSLFMYKRGGLMEYPKPRTALTQTNSLLLCYDPWGNPQCYFWWSGWESECAATAEEGYPMMESSRQGFF